ncbi:hypothetical protein Tco_0913518, partial [Tanacetum coccineum]
TLSVLGKFDGKCDEGFLVGYSLNSKAFRVYNLVTKKVEVNLHVKFLEEKPNVKGVGYRWMFDIDYLTDSMNYIPVSLENQTNPHAGTSKVTNSAGTLQTPNANASEEEDEAVELIVVPTVVRHIASKVRPRKSSTNSKAEEFLTKLQNLKTQEKEAYSTGISEDTPVILAFRREFDEFAPKHLREYVAEERTMTVDDLLQLVPKLIIKVDSLKTELKQTKSTIGKELVKLVKKGRNLQEEGLDEMVWNVMKDKSERLKSVDKGKRYKRRKESKGKDIDTSFEDISTGCEDISTGFEEVNTGGLGVSTGSRPVSTGSGPVSTGSEPVSTGSGPVSSARGQRE